MANPRCSGSVEPRYFIEVLGDHKSNCEFNTMIFFIGMQSRFVFSSMHEALYYRIDIAPGSNRSGSVYYRERYLYCINTAVSACVIL